MSYFVGEVKKQLHIRGWKYADLAKATGYATDTIRNFMKGKSNSANVERAIRKALDIKEV